MAKAVKKATKKTKAKPFKFDEVNGELNDRQMLFCMEYLNCKFNGTQAAKNAGYSENTAMEQASRLLSNVKVKNYIDILKEDLGKRIGISAEMIAREFASIGFSNIRDTLTVDGALNNVRSLDENVSKAISSIKITQMRAVEGEQPGEVVEIKMWDKLRALDGLNDMLGYKKPIKTELGLSAQIDTEIIIKGKKCE